MNYFNLYPGDYLRDTTRLTLMEHGAYLRLLLAYYSEEAPLPAEPALLYVISGAVNAAEKAAVLRVAERFFTLGEDGLRHNYRADAELHKYGASVGRAADKRSADADRQRRTRNDRIQMFSELRAAGVVPDGLISMRDLRALHAAHVTGEGEDVTPHVTPPVTRDSNAMSRRDETENIRDVTVTINQKPYISVGNTSTHTKVTTTRASPESGVCEIPIPGTPMPEPNPAVIAAVALRKRGLRVTAQHPDLLAAVAEGVTVAALLDMAETYPDKPAGYVISACRRQRADEAAPTPSPRAGAPPPRALPSKTLAGIHALQELGYGITQPTFDTPGLAAAGDHPGLDAIGHAEP